MTEIFLFTIFYFIMILIVASKFDKSEAQVVDTLVKTAVEVLEKHQQSYQVVRVPGAVEIPVAIAHFLAKNQNFTATIALGCVIKGDSDHYELVTQSVTTGLTQLALETQKPVIQGVLACHNAAQAQARAILGAEFAETALTMESLFKTE